jgi:hypothetical protein
MIREPQRYGLVAVVLSEETDREKYHPPPVPRDEHAVDCRCDDCKMLHNRTGRGVS